MWWSALAFAICIHVGQAQQVLHAQPPPHRLARSAASREENSVDTPLEKREVRKHSTNNLVDPFTQEEDSVTEKLIENRQATVGSTPIAAIKIGTPWKESKMIFDTGSNRLVAKTWTSIKYQLGRVEEGLVSEVKPKKDIYNPDDSKSYVKLFDNETRLKQKQSVVVYGSGIVSLLDGLDDVSIGGTKLTQFPFSEIKEDSLSMLHGGDHISGILGLQHMSGADAGSNEQSVFTQARKDGQMDAFGYCRGKDNDGVFVWGDQYSGGLKVDVIGKIHWAVNLSSLAFSGGELDKPHKARAEQPREDSSRVLALRRQNPVVSLLENEPRPGGEDESHSVEEPEGSSEGDEDAEPSSIDEQEVKDVVKSKLKAVMDKIVDSIADEVVSTSKGPKKFCRGDSECVAIIDTGSNIIAMPSAVLKHFAKHVLIKRDCSNLKTLPMLNFTLGTIEVRLPPLAYTMMIRLNENDKVGLKGSLLEGNISAMETYHRQRELSWHKALHKLRDERDIDLFVGLHPSERNFRGLDEDAVLCMPAFVPLDMMVPKKGQLFIIGSPLFEQYYTRWSWKRGDAHPAIYLEDLSSTKACKENAESEKLSHVGTWRHDEERDSSKLLRREQQSMQQARAVELTDGRSRSRHNAKIAVMELDEIRYPHWAKHAAIV